MPSSACAIAMIVRSMEVLKAAGSAVFCHSSAGISCYFQWQIALKVWFAAIFLSCLHWPTVGSRTVKCIWRSQLSCAAGFDEPQPVCFFLLDGMGVARVALAWDNLAEVLKSWPRTCLIARDPSDAEEILRFVANMWSNVWFATDVGCCFPLKVEEFSC